MFQILLCLLGFDWFRNQIASQREFVVSMVRYVSQTVHTIRTKASQKEKDLSRLLYRICGSSFNIQLMQNIKKLKGGGNSSETKKLGKSLACRLSSSVKSVHDAYILLSDKKTSRCNSCAHF